MYGAFIGDIVGSKYEFRNIKTKAFPLFSPGCDYTDDTIMTVAVAKAILLSRQEQNINSGKGFQEILVEVMRDFGRRYPHPTGAYGNSFAKWLRMENPAPYGSFGNGSAMRVSPCGLAAVTMEEALALARASACVSHNHPEGVKGAEAVAASIFLAKCGRSKAEIRRYITEHYYALDFTLDSIRDAYRFDGSCQGSVPQAIVAFLESDSFEDAIRNVISIGGDCDTTGAITGSIAWVFYTIASGSYADWVYNKLDPSMLEIKKQAISYLPEEFVLLADEFHEVCWQRAGTYARVGGCTPILSHAESKTFWTDWSTQQERLCSAPEGTSKRKTPAYTLAYVRLWEDRRMDRRLGARTSEYDSSCRKWRMRVQLDENREWFLSVFFRDNGTLDLFSLDEELAEDSHYEFLDEAGVRKSIYAPGDEEKLLAEVFIRYIKQYGGNRLLKKISPYITAQFHF